MKRFIVILLYFLLLPGCRCHDYIYWGFGHFKNAKKPCIEVGPVRCAAVRKLPIRPDGLLTSDIAYIMYRSDDVITTREHLVALCEGETPELVDKKIADQLEDNTKEAVFFVSIYNSCKEWAFSVCKDGKLYKADKVKRVDLDRDYLHIFGPEVRRYRQYIYQVSFDQPLRPPFSMTLCNGKQSASATWDDKTAGCCEINRQTLHNAYFSPYLYRD